MVALNFQHTDNVGERICDDSTLVDVPKISVCMAMYNASKYLRECIDSVLCQTFKDFEFLIIDDGSTDESVDIVLAYDDVRIKLIRSEHNYIASLNFLLKTAEGKYIARMDADDIMLPNRLKIQYDFMEEHPNIDILGGSLFCFNSEKEQVITYSTRLITVGDLLNGNVFAHPTVMMRASSIAQLSYDDGFIYAEDYHLWCKAFMAGLKLTNLPDILLKYRFTKSNTSVIHKQEQQAAALKTKKMLEEWVSENEARLAFPSDTVLPPSKKKLTVIITFLNEGEELEHTLAGIRKSVGDAVEIIVINDCSFDGYSYGEKIALYDAYYIVNRHRLGVAASRDLGVRLCQTPFFLLLDAHMRFYDGCWADSIIKELSANERQIVCCQGRYLYKDEHNNVVEESTLSSFGAFTPFAKNDIWPDIAWNFKESHPKQFVENIPIVLGAAYAASKSYWLRLRGLEGLKNYGADEQYISFKAWLEGGKCVILKNVIIGHIYRKQAPYVVMNSDVVYNLMFISNLLFPPEMYSETVALSVVKNREAALETLRIFEKNKNALNKLKGYLNSIFTREMQSILPMHQKCRIFDANQVKSVISVLPAIAQFLEMNMPKDDGLMQGKTGALLWLSFYEELNPQPQLEEIATQLYSSIETAIYEGRLPMNFQFGMAGIGWALLYLYHKRCISNLPHLLISKIDSNIRVINPELLDDISLETGAAGVLAYLTLRLRTKDLATPNISLEKWYKKAQDVFVSGQNREAIYYAHLFCTIYNSNEIVSNIQPIPLLGVWLNAPTYLPNRITKENCVLSNGILGTTLQVMLSEYVNKRNINEDQ